MNKKIIIALLAGVFFIGLMLINIVTSQPRYPKSQDTGPTSIPVMIPNLTLDQIFSFDHSLRNAFPKDQLITLIATGDIIPARLVNYQTKIKKNFFWPVEKVADVLKDGDITLINLESPLIVNCPLTNEGFKFCGDERHIEGLTFSGVDVVNIANNHAGNYGLLGIENTTNLLKAKGLKVTGSDSFATNAAFLESKGTRFAFLGYNDIGFKEEGIAWAVEEKIKDEIRAAKSKSDILIVSFHWGVEYVSQPTERQRDLAHLAIDSGADLIIGNHPHWIQAIEIYGPEKKLITYAHGNFIFDQEWSEKTKEGVVGRYTFYKGKLIDVEFLPLLITNYGQPEFIIDPRGQMILEQMKKESSFLIDY